MRIRKLALFLTFIVFSSVLYAQKVHYKDKYYTLVNHKIFHRGHNVYGKLTEGAKDSIYIIARELYNDKGKMKPEYKKRRGTSKFKIPEGFWEQRAKMQVGNTVALAQTGAALNQAQREENSAETLESTTTQKSTNVTATELPKNEKKIDNSDHFTDEKSISREKESSISSNSSREKSSERNYENKEIKKATKSSNTDQERIHTNSESTKEIEKSKKSLEKKNEKIEKSVSRSENRLEKKEKSIEKTVKKQTKQQKKFNVAQGAVTAGTVVAVMAKDTNSDFGTVYLKINKEKTFTDKWGNIMLFFDVINNSNKDLVILKPNNSLDNRLDFFSNTMECEDIPIAESNYVAKDLKIKDSDFITIPENSKIELFLNGRYQEWLACHSESVIIQLTYNPFVNAEQGEELAKEVKKEQQKALKRITPVKIESENIKFTLLKQ